MQEHEIRYSCQVALPGFGEAAQERLRTAKALIVGVGGLGCPAAQYLVAAGVGTIGLADHDTISVSNLHRQILYAENEVGQKKVTVAKKKLEAQNPHVRVNAHAVRASKETVLELISQYDLVLDATDNFSTHYLLNDACVLAGKPMVHGAIYQYEGHVAVWNMLNEDGSRSPNYRDAFPEVNAMAIPDCADGGVLPTIAGIIGTMQANETIKLITGAGDALKGRILIFNAQSMQSSIIKIGKTTKTTITSLGGSNNIQVISKKELDVRDGIYLIDVRTDEEHSDFNIGGINISLDSIEDRWREIGDAKEIVFYCASGKRSAQAAKWLQDKMPGLIIYSLEGGINSLRVTQG